MLFFLWPLLVKQAEVQGWNCGELTARNREQCLLKILSQGVIVLCHKIYLMQMESFISKLMMVVMDLNYGRVMEQKMGL